MNTILKIFLSMSLSGSLLILALFAAKHFWKDKISRQWQYYIWFVVVLRLLQAFPAFPLLRRNRTFKIRITQRRSQKPFIPCGRLHRQQLNIFG